VKTTNDDKKKQAVIDEWTDELATKMAKNTRVVMLDDGTIEFERHAQRGGHNRQTIEMLNDEGYVVRIFESIAETAEYFGVGTETVGRVLRGQRKIPLKPGYTIRRRETDTQRKEREMANKKREKNRKNKTKIKRNYGKK
jgi:nucleoid DNA-binding protein